MKVVNETLIKGHLDQLEYAIVQGDRSFIDAINHTIRASRTTGANNT